MRLNHFVSCGYLLLPACMVLLICIFFSFAVIFSSNITHWIEVAFVVIPFFFFHWSRPDSRVVRLIERMGSISSPNQKRILCMNKVDLVEKKKDLLKVVEEFSDLSGYERCVVLFLCFFFTNLQLVPDNSFNNFLGGS